MKGDAARTTAFSALPAALFATMRSPSQRARARTYAKGFNCCDHCGEPLTRHPEHSWRYDHTCASCGGLQVWALPAPLREDAAGSVPLPFGSKAAWSLTGTPGASAKTVWGDEAFPTDPTRVPPGGPKRVWGGPAWPAASLKPTPRAFDAPARPGPHPVRPPARIRTRSRTLSRTRTPGFNCCERCGVPLPRHPDQPWRYHHVCPKCARVQIWARLESLPTVPGSRWPDEGRPGTGRRRARRLGRGSRPGRRSIGFNCCERCREPLPRHPQQTWRYDGTCARCGRLQMWAQPATKPGAVPIVIAIAANAPPNRADRRGRGPRLRRYRGRHRAPRRMPRFLLAVISALVGPKA